MIFWLKKWILNRKFITDAFEFNYGEMLDFEVNKQRANIITMAQKDFQETMRDDLDKQAEELAQKKVAALLSNVDLNTVVKYDRTGKLIFIGDERADDARLANLRSEAILVADTTLWKLLIESPKKLAQDALFVNGKTMEDVVKGRAILYALSTQENILNTFKMLK